MGASLPVPYSQPFLSLPKTSGKPQTAPGISREPAEEGAKGSCFLQKQ